jgi:hypothetical protein
MAKRGNMKDYLILYRPDSTHGIQIWRECDSMDEAIKEWKNAMMTSPIEEPIIAKIIQIETKEKNKFQ